MLDGNRISRPTLSSTSTTSAPRKEKRGSNAGEKREKVSMIVSTRFHSMGLDYLRKLAQRSGGGNYGQGADSVPLRALPPAKPRTKLLRDPK